MNFLLFGKLHEDFDIFQCENTLFDPTIKVFFQLFILDVFIHNFEVNVLSRLSNKLERSNFRFQLL